MNISVGPTGSIIKGDVLDVNKTHLEELLKHYDDQLYLKWNPKKNRGYGLWELRRRPEYKEIVETIELDGIAVHRVDYRENDFTHHVFDLPVLNYQVLEKLRKADIWRVIDYSGKPGRVEQWSKDVNNNYFKHKNEIKQKAYDEMQYNLMQDRHILEDFRERLRSGIDPRHLMRFWK